MTLTRGGRLMLGAAVGFVLLVIYLPLLIVLISSFNADPTFGWPPSDLTLHWWQVAWSNQGARDAIATSVEVGLIATAVALLLGTLASFALVRYRFFGSASISLLIVLPIALPGIVTGLALNSAFTTMMGIGLSIWDGRRRARDVLHRRRLQQRQRAAAADRRQRRGGVHGPRRLAVDDVPVG